MNMFVVTHHNGDKLVIDADDYELSPNKKFATFFKDGKQVGVVTEFRSIVIQHVKVLIINLDEVL